MSAVITRVGAVSVSERGTGTPLFLLHANLHDRHDYDPIAASLATRFRVLAVDWPGHGDSDPLPAGTPASGALFADVLEDVLDRLDISRAAFIGNSVGGFAAARLAATQPARVSRLVLVNSGGFVGQNAVSRLACRALGTPAIAKVVLPRLIPRYMIAQSANDAAVTARAVARARTADGIEVAAALWRSFAESGYDLRGQIGHITAPTLLVWGVRDPLLPLREARRTQAAIPGARLVTLPAGHVVFSSEPEQFLAHAGEFLDEHSDTVER